MTAEKNPGAGELTLERVNVAPAQTWNRLRTNDVTLGVPAPARTGEVRAAVPRLFEGVACGMGEQVTAWAEALAGDARYVEVPARTRREEPVVVCVDPAADGAVADTAVMVREGAEATIVVAADAGTDAAGTSGSLLRVIAEDGACVRLYEYVGVGAGQQHLESVGLSLGAGTRVEVRQYLLGGGTVALGFEADLAGRDARVELTCRYHARDHELLDVNEVVRHHGRATKSALSYNGVLEDAATKSLRTTIDLVHGARGAQGNEAETVLVLGDDVTNKTLPTILCDEDDVAGNHGATIGSVSPEQLAFLASRGLSRDDSERLFARAVFEDAVMAAPCDEARAVAERARCARFLIASEEA